MGKDALPKTVYQKRRQALMAQLNDSGVAVVFNALERPRNADTYYPYRSSSDFHYLTGFSEPESVLFLLPGRAEGQAVLFLREKDKEREIWDGYRLGLSEAPKALGVDQAFNISELDSQAVKLLENRTELYVELGSEPEFDQQVLHWVSEVKKRVRTGIKAPESFLSLGTLLHEMRLIKSEQEIALMYKAAQISARGHAQAMRLCRPGLHEYHLEAQLVSEFMHQGARHCAYPSIVGSGANACVLHYIENTSLLKDGELVLIDAGAEYHHYAADITRTFPVNGKFSPQQRAVYEVVLKAQLDAIDAIQLGKPCMGYDEVAVKTLTQGLVDLGLLKGDPDALIEDKAYKKFYMHRTGHWLGMDVHDVGRYKLDGHWRPLKENMVLTVEPGLYIAPDSDVDAQWHGIGIRIEDDVVVKKEGPLVLTDQVPKTIESIEALMSEPLLTEYA